MNSIRRRWVRAAIVLFLISVPSGCVWAQNEFFVFDVAPPADAPPTGTDSGQ